MKSENVVYDKALAFSIRVVKLYKYLSEEKSEYVMSKQLLRSGTSIGANISESISAESTSDFIHKMAISQKEAEETLYWLILLFKTDYLSEMQYNSMYEDCREIKKLLASIALTIKKHPKIHNS
ncbi:four helix bundle protein [Bacteroides sp. UBA939]|uniref:four helix bundle protein n=1 Tax=Bacteroides sp. UBA939 TaxID=1946092 RepID=UPI0025C4062F|nr:four helix bundle protein [Bacteroides sp. UBA939]